MNALAGFLTMPQGLAQTLGPMMQAQPPQMAPAPAAPPMAAPRGGGVRDFLGTLGDALLAGAGGEPIYGPKKDRARIGGQVAQFLGISDPNLVAVFQDDPQTGYAMWKASQPSQGEPFTLNAGDIRFAADGSIIAQAPGGGGDLPTFIRELDALGIDPRSQQALELYYGKNSPAGYLLRPSGGAAQSAGIPTVSDQASYDAVPPGGQYRDPQGNLRTKGGGVGNGAGGF